jgi:TonB family protein
LDLTFFDASGRDSLTERQLGRLDHLQLEDADRTMVNSARNLYWSFFTRMKRQVQVEWDPVGVYRREDPSGRLYQQRDRYTVLAVTLGTGGVLEEASVERSCGLEFLDQEAIRAFRTASPFPNIPEGLKDDEGLIDVTFGFMLSLSGRVSIDRLPEF